MTEQLKVGVCWIIDRIKYGGGAHLGLQKITDQANSEGMLILLLKSGFGDSIMD